MSCSNLCSKAFSRSSNVVIFTRSGLGSSRGVIAAPPWSFHPALAVAESQPKRGNARMSLEKLREWVGRTQAIEDFAAPFPVRALTATFDEKDPDPRHGDPLPPLWHWLYFLDTAPQSKIWPDGHAERGDFLPPVPLPRRMWAGSRFAFAAQPLRIGDTIRRASKVKSVEPKSGSTGAVGVCTVEDTVASARGTALCRADDHVYP